MVALSCFASGALRNAAVDHALADLLFAVIVGRLHAFGEHEAKVVLRQIILARLQRFLVDILHDRKPRSEIRGLLRGRRITNQVKKAVSVCEHRTMEALGRHFVAAVPGRKQPPRPIQKLLGPSLGLLVQMLFQKLKGQALLTDALFAPWRERISPRREGRQGWEDGYRDGSSVHQVIKRLEKNAHTDRALSRRLKELTNSCQV